MKPENARGGFLTQSDSPGTINANGDYSGGGVGPKVFEIGPPSTEIWLVRRLLVYIESSSTMRPANYGNGSALPNGIEVVISQTDGDPVSLTGALPIMNNGEWAAVCHDAAHVGIGVSGSDAYSMRWTFANDYGEAIRLIGARGHKLQVLLSDDLGACDEHYFRAAARLEAP